MGTVRLCGKLLGYLVQQEDGGGTRVGGQRLVALEDESCYSGGEKTGLDLSQRGKWGDVALENIRR